MAWKEKHFRLLKKDKLEILVENMFTSFSLIVQLCIALSLVLTWRCWLFTIIWIVFVLKGCNKDPIKFYIEKCKGKCSILFFAVKNAKIGGGFVDVFKRFTSYLRKRDRWRWTDWESVHLTREGILHLGHFEWNWLRAARQIAL